MSKLTELITLAIGKIKKPFGYTDCTIGLDYLRDSLAEAVELEEENERLLNSVTLIKDKARLPLTAKSEVIEDLQKLIAGQALKEGEDD